MNAINTMNRMNRMNIMRRIMTMIMIAIILAGALIILIMQIIIKAKPRSKPDATRGKKHCPENVQKSQTSCSICSETHESMREM